MRLFVAVEISGEARAAAARVAGQLQRELGRTLVARWVEAENLHLTVRFIGHVADEQAPAVLDALRPPLPLPPFDLVLGSPGAFPRSGPPRVIWIGLAEGLEPLAAMHHELNRRLAPLGLPPEDRPFSAHLTLARVKEGSGATRRAIAAATAEPVRSHVTHATVFQSLLSPRGARYEAMLHVACAG